MTTQKERKKIEDFNGVNEYYCARCHRIHKRMMMRKPKWEEQKKTVFLKPFKNCQDHAYEVDPNDLDFKAKTLKLMDKLKDAIWEENYKKMEHIIREITKLQEKFGGN